MRDQKFSQTRKNNPNRQYELGTEKRNVENSKEPQQAEHQIDDNLYLYKPNQETYSNETSEYSYKYFVKSKNSNTLRYRNFKHVDQYYQHFDLNNPFYFSTIQNGLHSNPNTQDKHFNNSFQTFYYNKNNNNNRYNQSYSSHFKKDRTVSTRREFSCSYVFN